jgi:hypothetical protein
MHGVTLTRRHAVVLLAIATWLVLSHLNFARNLYEAYTSGEDRPAGYWGAHVLLIVVNLLVAAVLARWGWRARGARRGTPATPGEGLGGVPDEGWNSSHPTGRARAQVARDRADP